MRKDLTKKSTERNGLVKATKLKILMDYFIGDVQS